MARFRLVVVVAASVLMVVGCGQPAVEIPAEPQHLPARTNFPRTKGGPVGQKAKKADDYLPKPTDKH